MNEAIEVLEGSERHTQEISKIWKYVYNSWDVNGSIENVHRMLTQCCNRLVLPNGYDERSTIPIALRCSNALISAGELTHDESIYIVLNIVFKYPYRVAVMLDSENSAFDCVRELIARSTRSNVERLYEIVLLSCGGTCVQDNIIKPLSWITYATTRVYDVFRDLRMDHLAIAVRLLMKIPQIQGGAQLAVIAACTALIENMMNRPEVSFLKSEIEAMRSIVRSSQAINHRVLLGMACLKVQHPKMTPRDDGFNLYLATFLHIMIDMRLLDIEIQTHVLDSNRAIITPAYLARLVVNLSTSKSIPDIIKRTRCIRFMYMNLSLSFFLCISPSHTHTHTQIQTRMASNNLIDRYETTVSRSNLRSQYFSSERDYKEYGHSSNRKFETRC